MTRRVPILCPRCGEPAVEVVQTQPWQGSIRRTRRCANGHRMVTREVPERVLEGAGQA